MWRSGGGHQRQSEPFPLRGQQRRPVPLPEPTPCNRVSLCAHTKRLKLAKRQETHLLDCQLKQSPGQIIRGDVAFCVFLCQQVQPGQCLLTQACQPREKCGKLHTYPPSEPQRCFQTCKYASSPGTSAHNTSRAQSKHLACGQVGYLDAADHCHAFLVDPFSHFVHQGLHLAMNLPLEGR